MTPDGIPGAHPPRPLLSQRAEERLRPRQKEILDHLEALFLAEGFSRFTVGDLAGRLGCSRRTLYELAPSKEELVLTVLDRFLHRVGRTALASIDPDAPIADRIRAYFRGGQEILRQTVAFADDVTDAPAVGRLLERHFRYVDDVVEALLALGIESGELRVARPDLVSAIITGATLHLARPDVWEEVGEVEAADEVIDLVLASLLVD